MYTQITNQIRIKRLIATQKMKRKLKKKRNDRVPGDKRRLFKQKQLGINRYKRTLFERIYAKIKSINILFKSISHITDRQI